jgi:hypothetical protein
MLHLDLLDNSARARHIDAPKSAPMRTQHKTKCFRHLYAHVRARADGGSTGDVRARADGGVTGDPVVSAE